jgi:hypothetical protein
MDDGGGAPHQPGRGVGADPTRTGRAAIAVGNGTAARATCGSSDANTGVKCGPPGGARVRRHSRLAWASLTALAGVAVWLWLIDKRAAAEGTAGALVGCLALILPPRERMAVLPRRLRALPRRYDAAPALATLLSSPGYGLNWFHGANPYDEAVHLLNGALAGAVFAALLRADGRRRIARQLIGAGAVFGLGLGTAWEAFEWATAIVGDRTDTWTDVALTAAGAALAAAWRPGRRAGMPGLAAHRAREG